MPGGELNSRPTPNAFGAALMLQIINRELWILFSLQHSFDVACLRERCELLACDKFKRFAQAFCCVGVSTFVLSKSRIQINGRTKVVPFCPLEDVNPCHKYLPGGRVELPTKGL